VFKIECLRLLLDHASKMQLLDNSVIDEMIHCTQAEVDNQTDDLGCGLVRRYGYRFPNESGGNGARCDFVSTKAKWLRLIRTHIPDGLDVSAARDFAINTQRKISPTSCTMSKMIAVFLS
jgi:hypothetical protein